MYTFFLNCVCINIMVSFFVFYSCLITCVYLLVYLVFWLFTLMHVCKPTADEYRHNIFEILLQLLQ